MIQLEYVGRVKTSYLTGEEPKEEKGLRMQQYSLCLQ